MSLKIWQLALVLFSLMAISGIACGKSLLIGGIWQSSEDRLTNQNWAELFSEKYGDDYEYIPTYGEGLKDLGGVKDATPQYGVYKDKLTGATIPVPETVSYKPTENNGLTSDLLDGVNDDNYDTIYAHSGGARTAVTALLYQGVTAKTLVLISPARGDMESDLYLWEIQQLLDLGIVEEIVVYQSAVDTPVLNELWQGKFYPGDIDSDNFKIQYVTNEQLGGKTGTDAHIQMWDTVLNLELGRDPLTPAPKPTEETTPTAKGIPKSLLKKEFLASLKTPMLSPSTSGISWVSDPNKVGTGDPASSGATYFDKSNGIWYIDALSWSGDLSLYPSPPAPLHFASGELNSYGYNWIYLSPEKTGMIAYPYYINYVENYLASIGSSGTAAGYGLLIDESQNGGGGW